MKTNKDSNYKSNLKIWITIIILAIIYSTLYLALQIPQLIHYLILFLAATTLMIWRLNHLIIKGFEGTVLGTLIMPYASGFPNIVFTLIIALSVGSGILVVDNAIVNNITNLTVILGICAVFTSLEIVPKKRKKIKEHIESRINKVSIQITSIAAIVFTAILWFLAKDGIINFNDGVVLIVIFLFWQLFQISEVAKNNIREKKEVKLNIILDIILILISAYLIYISMNSIVEYISLLNHPIINKSNLGIITGILAVIPNAIFAFYYTYKKRGDIVYSSQIGDGHICIPFCIGLFALFNSIVINSIFYFSISIVLISLIIHLIFITFANRLPRIIGLVLSISYFYFIYIGFV